MAFSGRSFFAVRTKIYFAKIADLKAAFAVPITHKQHVDGVLMFHAPEVKDEDERLTEVISGIATQLGFALQHKRLEEELLTHQARVRRSHENLEEQVEQRVHQQEAVVDLGLQALGGADLTVLMRSVTQLVAKTLRVQFCKVLELLPGNDALILRAGLGGEKGLSAGQP